jgi:hypothetical protein
MSLTDFSEPQPSLAWQFESSNVDYVTNLIPSAQVSPGPGQLVGSAALVTDAPTSNTAVSFPNSGTMNLGTSPVNVDLTTSNIFVEFWIYMNSGISFPCVISVGGGSWNWALAFNNTTLNPRLGMKYDANNLTSSVAIAGFQTWNHVAFSFNRTSAGAGTAYIFVNGQPGGSMAVTGLTYSAAETARIGGYVDSGNYFNGYIRDLRVVQGGVVPTTNFTPLASAPFSYASPGYVPNMGTTVFTLLGQFVTYVPGKFGSAIKLTNPVNADTEYISYPIPTIRIEEAGFSCACWVNFQALPPSIYQGYFLNFYGSTSTGLALNLPTIYALLDYATSKIVLVYYVANDTFMIPTDYVVSLNTWYHFAFTIYGGYVRMYINGTQTTNPRTYDATTYANLNINTRFNLGNSVLGGYSVSFTIDDLRIYNTALTAAQIQSIYTQSGAPASNFRVMPQPRLAWDFNGTTTDYVTGLVPANYAGASANAITYVNAAIYGTGKYGQSINVYNTSNTFYTNTLQYRLPSAIGPPYSISCWGKINTVWVPGNGNFGSLFLRNISSPVNSFVIKLPSYSVGQSSFECSVLNVNNIGSNFQNYLTGVQTWFFMCISVLPQSATLYFWSPVYSAIQSSTVTTTSTYATCGTDIATCISGYTEGNTTNQPFNGELDDLRIFDRALTSSQVQSIYNQQGMPGRAVQNGDGLVLYTPFNGTTTDSISSVVPALTGSVSYDTVNAKYTQSLIVTNTPGANATNYLEYPKTIDIAVTGLTCAFWVRTATDVTTGQSLVSFRGVAQYQGQIRYEIYNTKFTMTYWNGKSGGGQASAYAYNIGPVLSTNTWYHLAIAIKPNGNISFYVNAVEYAAGQNCGLRDIGPTNSRVDSFFVGTSAVNPNYQNAFSGEFDDLRLYRYALETPAIVSLYNTASPANFNPPSTSMSGAPLFNQLSQSAASSAVGAFSLRAVNGVTAKAVQVRPQAQFPPGPFVNPSGTLNGPYTETITGYAFGGTGTYTVLGSSRVSSGREPWKAFDGFDGGFGTRWISSSTYTANSPYTGTASTIANSVTYPGEWLQIKLHQSIVLSSYSIYPQNTNNIPLTWNVFASNDGSTWTVIDQRGTAPTEGQYNNYTISGTPTSYSYYRIGCYVVSSGTSFAVVEMKLYGSNASWNTDFYADERGNLLTAPVIGMSLQNWLGGATGYVTKWYDQSGKGNDASQNTAANQPIIQRATKGPGYSALFNGTTTQLVSTLSGSLDSTNYTICSATRRRAVGEMYYIGTNGPSSTRQQLSAGYYTDTSTILNEHSYALVGVTIPGYSAGSEPMGYDFYNFSQTNGMYVYNWRSGTSYASGNSGLTLPMTSSGNILLGYAPWSGNKYFSGEIFELTIFNTSLFDLSGSTPGTYTTPPSIIQSIYNSQLGYTGT